MAVIDSKKLLPSSKTSSAITETQKPFLIPVSNILYKKDVNISQKLLKPADKTTQESGGSLVVLRKKITKIEDVIGNTYLVQQKESDRKRKEKERRKAEEREKKLETKPKEDPKTLAKVSKPGISILDTINRFLSFTFAGFLVNNYIKYLPKLLEFGKYIEPVTKFIDAFAKNAVDGVIKFIDLGYRAYDNVNKMIESIGGKDAAKEFDKFSGELNKLLNGAIMASMLIASTAPRSPKGVSGALGAGKNIGASTLTKSTSGFGAGTAMTPGRYRLPGQAKASSFGLEQARRGLTFEQSVAAQQASKQVATQGAKQSLKSLIAVPLVGSLIGFIIDTVVFREKPSRAAAGAVGSALGQGIGIFLAGSTTFGLGAGIGMFVGGFVGDWLGKSLYDVLTGYKPEPTQARAQGGTVTSGQSTVSPTRKIKKQKTQPRRRYIPSKVQPGRDVGGKLRIEGLYGEDKPGKRSALRALKNSSEDLKKMKSLNGVAGGMLGAGIDMALGQKPDRKLANSLGTMFGGVVEAAVNAELNSSFSDISKAIAMANGGVVPSREIGAGMSIGEKIGRYISNAFSIALESSASKVLQNLNLELNLEGGPPGSMPDAGPGGGPLTQSQQEAFEKIRKIAEKVGSPNPSVTAAIAMLETGWLSNPDSVYFMSGKTNPFGQTGRGPKGSVIGKDGQEHAVYNNLEEGVKAHVDRWKSSYIGKTPQEIIESIRTGRGAGAPGMYNVSPSWTSKVLSTFQSGTQPQPSATPTRGAFASVLPRGNPVFASGFGSRWGRQHRGIDIGVDANSPVTALDDGEVVDIYRSYGGHGDGVVVRHSDGTKIVYGHVNSKVRVGAKIKKGQTIATVKGWFNAYGNKDNTHLHLERHVGGAAQDPTGYLNSILQQRQRSQRQASVAPVQKSREIASLQTDTSYTVVHDVNNIVMPLLPA